MVKQFAAALVAGVMVFGIAGCGSSNSLTSKDASTEGSRKTPPAPQPSVTGTPNAPQTPKPTKSAEPEQTELTNNYNKQISFTNHKTNYYLTINYSNNI